MTTVFLTFAMLLLVDGVLGGEKIVGTVSGNLDGVSIILTKVECSGNSSVTTEPERDGSYKFSDVSNGFYFVTLGKKDSLYPDKAAITPASIPEYTVLKIKDNAAKEVDFEVK